jgi:hypothetical protein
MSYYSDKTEDQKEAARTYARERQREYRKRPEVIERFRGYIQTYKEKHIEELREKARIRDRANRADPIKRARVERNAAKHKEGLKRLVIEKYSNSSMLCAWCNEGRMPCLSIDHIDGGGNAHRKEILKSAGLNFYQWLKKEGFPPGFRVLCMNCQFISLHEMRKIGRAHV